jgi:hypothetical protein
MDLDRLADPDYPRGSVHVLPAEPKQLARAQAAHDPGVQVGPPPRRQLHTQQLLHLGDRHGPGLPAGAARAGHELGDVARHQAVTLRPADRPDQHRARRRDGRRGVTIADHASQQPLYLAGAQRNYLDGADRLDDPAARVLVAAPRDGGADLRRRVSQPVGHDLLNRRIPPGDGARAAAPDGTRPGTPRPWWPGGVPHC